MSQLLSEAHDAAMPDRNVRPVVRLLAGRVDGVRCDDEGHEPGDAQQDHDGNARGHEARTRDVPEESAGAGAINRILTEEEACRMLDMVMEYGAAKLQGHQAGAAFHFGRVVTFLWGPASHE